MHQFQDELRQALWKYALLPVLLLTVAGLLLMVGSWQHYVVKDNARHRTQLVSGIETVMEDGARRVERIGNQLEKSPGSIEKIQRDGKSRAEIMAAVYPELDNTDAGLTFYLLDNQGKVVAGSRQQLPPGLQDLSEEWGFLQRMGRSPAEMQAELAGGSPRTNRYLLMGKAVKTAGQVDGFILLVLPGEALQNRLMSGKQDAILLDQFDNLLFPWSQQTAAGKAPAVFRHNKASLVHYEQQLYYATGRDVGHGFTVLAVTPVTNLLSRYVLGAALLLALFILMVPIIGVSVLRESRGKAKSIDELVEAFAAVKTGNWTHPLNLQPASGLAVVQEAYEHMTRSLQELMRKNEEEAKASVISEIRQLESQFNPHFLFNTLENIKFMVKLDSDAAMSMIKSLSKLLRYSINNTVRRVKLADDLAYVRGYMEIQQRRFGNRLVYQEQIDPQSLSCEIPKLIFQPALENAVKYGADAKGRIAISLQVEFGRDTLQIRIQDRGRGMDAPTISRLQALLDSEANDSVHMGVYNIHRRIRLMYGKPYGVQVKQREGGGTEVLLVLPIIWEEGKHAETGNRGR
ncbi:MAG: sensor histidine kinase [Selenomonas sp.]|uniref:sensor histidine kinase n=1 Tax=Selenomonas sp. TaxID=2053611 RepID=UPI0025E84C80|nr:sensor histidine kinase [Selenomonas sp.]MCR5438881.1 sensor histidine kinase [Selenomonas sp.]